MAKIIRLPIAPQEEERVPVCSDCDHAAMSHYGVYCTYFNEYVEEPVAADCNLFERA